MCSTSNAAAVDTGRCFRIPAPVLHRPVTGYYAAMGSPTVEERYDVWHRERFQRIGGEFEPTSPWHRMALRQIPPGSLRGLRVLEVGCGAGHFAQWLHEQGGQVVAVDFSGEACMIARTVADPAVEVLQLDAQDLVGRLGRDRFDLVISLETLEHVPDHNRALREIVAVTRPGGRIIVSTPNHLSAQGLHRLMMWMARRPYSEMGQPINNVMIGAARPWKLRRLGCRVDAVDGAVYFLQIPGTDRRINLRFLRRFKRLAMHVMVAATKNP